MALPKEHFPLEKLHETYQPEFLLQEGRYTNVYLGKMQGSSIPVVIKLIKSAMFTNPKAVQLLSNEATVLQKSTHAHIVNCIDFGKEENHVYLVSEFIQGIKLTTLIENNSLSYQKCLDVILQIAYAVLHLHSHNIVHKDIKPANIMLSEEGTAKLIDFGIASEITSSNAPQLGIGSYGYMCPEQQAHPSRAKPYFDIYALGVVAYELLTGTFSQGKFRFQSIPSILQPLLRKALSVDPKERYPDIVDFIHDLSNAIQETYKDNTILSQDLKQFCERLVTEKQRSLPHTPPQWNEMNIGFAKAPIYSMFPAIFDFVSFQNNTSMFYYATCTSNRIENMVQLSHLHGMIHQYIDNKLPSTDHSPFLLKDFFAALNDSVYKRTYLDTFSLGVIHFNPSDQFYTFVGSGTFALWNRKNGKNKYSKQNYSTPFLGKEQSPSWNILSESWMEHDRVLFPLLFQSVASTNVEQTIQDTLVEHGSHSSTATSHALHRSLTSLDQSGLFTNGVLCIDNTIF